MFFYVFFCNLIKVKQFWFCFIILLHLISSSLHTRSLFVPYAYVSIESIDCILLSSFELKAILLIYSVKTLCLSLLNLCCVSNISFYFLRILFNLFSNYLLEVYFLLNGLFYFQFALLLNSLDNFEI